MIDGDLPEPLQPLMLNVDGITSEIRKKISDAWNQTTETEHEDLIQRLRYIENPLQRVPIAYKWAFEALLEDT